jgi:autotransporter-associated beta strand protein
VGWNNADATFNGTIKNDGTTTLIKVGTGKWTLTGANTWSGGFSISNGIVLANNSTGSALGSGAVNVYGGAVLGGTGSVGAPVTVHSGGTLAPGINTGTLTFTSTLTLNSGSALSYDLGPTNSSDKALINGSVTLGGTLHVTNRAGFGPGIYTLLTYTGTLGGSLPGIGVVPAGYGFTLDTNTLGQVRLLVTLTAKPRFISPARLGTNLWMRGTNGTANGSYYVLSATNVAQPLSNWTKLATNQFDAAGTFSFTNAIEANTAARFFLLQLQ